MKQIHTLTITLIIIIASMGAITASEESEDLQSIQREIVIDGANWTAGITSVSGLTEAEKHRLALANIIPEPNGKIVSSGERVLMHEETFDWRDECGVTPVRSQGSCGSCWAFSAIGAVESAFLINAEKNLDLSEQHLVSVCCSAGSCSGGWPDWSLDYIRDTGVPDEDCFPYKSRNSACDPCDGWEDRAYKIKDHVYVEPSIDDFKWALKEYGPVSVVLTVPSDWYYYRSGVYEPVRDVGWANHAVLLTGWDDTDGCWFIKNSWGAGWGEQGYARVKYGNLEKYNYAYAVTGIIEHGASPKPGRWHKPAGATGTTEYSENYRSEKAIDNNSGTYWFSKYKEENPRITFDLGETLTISSVRTDIFWRDLPMTCVLESSTDGVVWDPAGKFELLSNPKQLNFSAVECRYVRMSQPDNRRGYGTCSEFDVFVTAEEAPTQDMSITLHHEGKPNTVIPIDEGLTGITLIRGNETVLVWYANIY